MSKHISKIDFNNYFKLACKPTKHLVRSFLLENKFRNFHIKKYDEKKSLNLLKLKKIIKVSKNLRKKSWNDSWRSVYIAFKKNKKVSNLFPIYKDNSKIIRLLGYFVVFKNKHSFEKISELFLYNIFNFFNFFKDCKKILYFGCGTGKNILILKKNYPFMNVVGFDRSPYSGKIISEINKHYKFNIQFKLFDFFSPGKSKLDLSTRSKKKHGVLTIHSLEQTGHKFTKFFNFLKKINPEIVVNIEPELYFYKASNNFDKSMIEFNKKKGYLNGYVNFLKQQEDKNVIEIIMLKRLYVGSESHEPFNLIVYKFI